LSEESETPKSIIGINRKVTYTLFDFDYEEKESQSLTIDVIIIPSEEAIAALSLLSDGFM
jgi:hypothetical protein